MPETYPANVPDLVVTGSYNTTPIISSIRFPTGVGKPMTRNRFTGELFNSTWRIMMTDIQFQTLMGWYHNTLNKVLTFNFPEPMSGTLREYSFITAPQINHIGVDQYMVTFNVKSTVGYN